MTTRPDVQALWLGEMQSEIGILKTNLMLAEIHLRVAAEQKVKDDALIEALKARALGAEQANRDLREMIRPSTRKAPAKARPKAA